MRNLVKRVLSAAGTLFLLAPLSTRQGEAQSCSSCQWTTNAYEYTYESYGCGSGSIYCCFYYYEIYNYYYCGYLEYATETFLGERCFIDN